MANPPPIWRELACPTCDMQIALFYFRDDRLTADYRMSGRGALKPGDEPETMHKVWFRGIDIEEELSDCTDSLWDAECVCRMNRLSARTTVQMVKDSPKKRVLLEVR